MSTLQEEIARLRTLQESYNELAARVYHTKETVTVNLRTGDGGSVDWTQHAITVLDISDNIQSVYKLNADGTCTFEVPSGHQYSIGFPQLAAYAKPQKQSYASTLYERHIVYEYNIDTRIETIKINIIDGLTLSTIPVLDEMDISIITDSGDTYTSKVTGHKAEFKIEYGKRCTIIAPFVDGYRSEYEGQFITGIFLRGVTIKYIEEDYGVFGVDTNGRKYTIEECEALEDKTIIKYGYYNDANLASSIRVDGGMGNGFYWVLGSETIGSLQWSIENVLFDVSRIPLWNNVGDWKYAGMYFSKTIRDIGLELFPDSLDGTPAVNACMAMSINIGGKEHTGFLPTTEQMRCIMKTNVTLFTALYNAIGIKAYDFHSKGFVTSGQTNATVATDIREPDNLSYAGSKNRANSVFILYDIY